MSAPKLSDSAPTADEVVRRFDHIIGRDLSEDVFYLFESVSLNLNALIQDAHFPQSKYLFKHKKSPYTYLTDVIMY